jgi:hypothetical protein
MKSVFKTTINAVYRFLWCFGEAIKRAFWPKPILLLVGLYALTPIMPAPEAIVPGSIAFFASIIFTAYFIVTACYLLHAITFKLGRAIFNVFLKENSNEYTTKN